jgi:hypothetical protein
VKNGVYKLGDFGFGKETPESISNTILGSPLTEAPEIKEAFNTPYPT